MTYHNGDHVTTASGRNGIVTHQYPSGRCTVIFDTGFRAIVPEYMLSLSETVR